MIRADDHARSVLRCNLMTTPPVPFYTRAHMRDEPENASSPYTFKGVKLGEGFAPFGVGHKARSSRLLRTTRPRAAWPKIGPTSAGLKSTERTDQIWAVTTIQMDAPPLGSKLSRSRGGGLMRWDTKTREPADETKSFYWRYHGMAVVRIDDPRLPWELRELLAQHMTRQHGICRQLEKERA